MRQHNLRTGMRVEGSHTRGGRSGLMVAAMVLLLCLFGGSAEAQFSGPAIGASTPVNRPVTPMTDPAILYPGARDIHVGQGDVPSIHLYGAPHYAPPVRVSLDGTIQLPLIGIVPGCGPAHPTTATLVVARMSRPP